MMGECLAPPQRWLWEVNEGRQGEMGQGGVRPQEWKEDWR
jgi:hypothetical protein